MWTTHKEVGAEIKCLIFSPEPPLQSSPSFTFPSHACPALLLTKPWCSSFPLQLHGPPKQAGLALGHGRAESAGEDSSVTLQTRQEL